MAEKYRLRSEGCQSAPDPRQHLATRSGLRQTATGTGRGEENLVLLGVPLVMDLGAFWNQALAAFLATTANDVAPALGSHPGTEAVLAFSSALGWLVSPFHLGS